jgi:hypothetical protein
MHACRENQPLFSLSGLTVKWVGGMRLVFDFYDVQQSQKKKHVRDEKKGCDWRGFERFHMIGWLGGLGLARQRSNLKIPIFEMCNRAVERWIG